MEDEEVVIIISAVFTCITQLDLYAFRVYPWQWGLYFANYIFNHTFLSLFLSFSLSLSAFPSHSVKKIEMPVIMSKTSQLGDPEFRPSHDIRKTSPVTNERK